MGNGFVSQGICPKCQGENLDYGVLEPVDECIYYPFTCPDCGFVGKEWYGVSYIESTEVK